MCGLIKQQNPSPAPPHGRALGVWLVCWIGYLVAGHATLPAVCWGGNCR